MNILSRSLVVLNLYFDDMLFGQYDFSDMVGKSLPTRESNVLSTVFYPVSRTPEQKFPYVVQKRLSVEFFVKCSFRVIRRFYPRGAIGLDLSGLPCL
jgi:hypothetical protein